MPSSATRDLIFDDEMDDPSSGWSELHQDFADINYELGNLAFHIHKNGAWAYTVRQLDADQAVLRPVAQFTTDSDGVFGLLCGNSDGVFYGAVVDTNGGYVFVKIEGTDVQVLQRDDEAGLNVAAGEQSVIGIQCTASSSGELRIRLVLPDDGVAAIYQQMTGGPASFNVVGAYAESSTDGEYNVTVPEIGAYGLDAATTPSAGAQALLNHVPPDFQPTCAEGPVPPLFAEPAQFVDTCVMNMAVTGPGDPPDGAEFAEYIQFADKQTMDDAYQQRVTAFGVESTGSCQSGPNETTWSISGTDFGRVQCAPQTIGIRFDWTDERLNILSTLIDFDGDYQSTYDQWIDAGPFE